MSTFIVRFVGDTTDAFRGKVRHVATGEEAVFASPAELLAFLEGMNAVSDLAAVSPPGEGKPAARPQLREESANTGISRGSARGDAAQDGGQ
ncbi:MAG: hypothetical protein GF330_09665 [Candidatus Eisenbacteria bacterium]|nr:hypothetical protein [Candidatus Eisenbacteria bacterium]